MTCCDVFSARREAGTKVVFSTTVTRSHAMPSIILAVQAVWRYAIVQESSYSPAHRPQHTTILSSRLSLPVARIEQRAEGKLLLQQSVPKWRCQQRLVQLKTTFNSSNICHIDRQAACSLCQGKPSLACSSSVSSLLR